MENNRSLAGRWIKWMKFLTSLWILIPLTAQAHLLSITPTTPFPENLVAQSTVSATFKITNISSRANVTAINQTIFPAGSGLSLASSSCGKVLKPGQFCTIVVNATGNTPGQTINGSLQIWAKPTADGVQYSFSIKVIAGSLPSISLTQVDSSGLPALRDPIAVANNGNILIMGGTSGNFHDFSGASFNRTLYVFNPVSGQIFSMLIENTNLPIEVQRILGSTEPQELLDGDTLYLLGGYYNPPNTNTYTTLSDIVSINVPGVINAIINNDIDLGPYIHVYNDVPQFKVTGGQLGKIGNDFYLAYGQNCEGLYCATLQVYTNSIYRFITDPALTSVDILATVSHPDLDGSGWRRRDYTLAPMIQGGIEYLLALGGPFTPGSNALVWTNIISFNADILGNNNVLNQQGNQYLAPFLAMYQQSKGLSFVATFSGLSNLYWTTSGLVYNNQTNYGNVLDLISIDAAGQAQEYVNLQPLCSGQPLSSCLYMGLMAKFIPYGNFFDSRGMLLLDQLPQNTPTLVGYLYGGLLSSVQVIFTGGSYVTNNLYAVYVTPAGDGSAHWLNVTNFSG